MSLSLEDSLRNLWASTDKIKPRDEKKKKIKQKKKTPESGCRQDLHIPSALTFWAVNAKQALGPRYLGAGKHIPPLSLSAQGNS